ncbi:MAG: sigma-70 family RNA polymerase sigma factor [Thermogemmatispora sp.]|uniref:RNA polymerase sigma factor n=1 Tax=Thermogemmatispora sp. TaxID=1968838 RepID=UPI00260E9DC0|nr:hypothetical protein [Thermogemmatispora sp.]MBX5455828.1 sigma-70 family RNA polymerase sigma factor [Thermogemmatispora sp.]
MESRGSSSHGETGPQPDVASGAAARPETDERLLPLAQWSVPALARACAEETSRFLKQNRADERYCLELFRRALMLRDEEAWACLYQQYAPLVLSWIHQHPAATPLLEHDGGQSVVNLVFAKFAQALTPGRVQQFDSLAALLKYLKMCVHSVVTDEGRVQQLQQLEQTLEALEHEPAVADPAEEVVAQLSAQDLWQAILEELHSEEERMLIYLAYVQGLKPSEICLRFQHLFPSVNDVYRLKRNMLDRLRRNRRLQALMKGS